MDKKEKRNKLIQRLRSHYRLIIYNDSSYQTVWSLKLSPLRVLVVGGFLSFLLVMITTVIIAYTPLREAIPGYPSSKERNTIIRNAMVVDSLEQQLLIRDNYFEKIKALIKGDIPPETESGNDSNLVVHQIKLGKYNSDSAFQQKLMEEQMNLSLQQAPNTSRSISNIHFFIPITGMVNERFDASKGHYAIDIIGQPNARVSSVLDGTVIFADYTINTGYVIYVQHENSIISVYKHNAELLKTVGDRVKAGEAIAIMGNSGQLSTGPHLHFELWQKGVALDPELYIDF